MSYFKQIEISDIYGQTVENTSYGEMRTVIPFRIAGASFSGNVVDPNYWTTSVTGSGTVTQTGIQQTVATGGTANSSASVSSLTIARYVATYQNRFLCRVMTGDTGTANNVRRWGIFNGTDGAYFKLAGTTLSVCTMIGGVETAVASGSWSGDQTVPVLTNLVLYEIYYTTGRLVFEINGAVAHVASFPTVPWTNTLHLPTFLGNVNSGGLASNLTLTARVVTITRLGPDVTQPKFSRVTAAATTTMKLGPGVLHRITLGNPTGTLITVYDNTAGSGTVVTIINAPAQANPVTLEYGLPFNVGLTVVSTGTWDATFVYE